MPMPAIPWPSARRRAKVYESRCVRQTHVDRAYLSLAPRDRGARSVPVANPGAPGRMRQRTDDAAAASAGAARPNHGSVHRRGAHGDNASSAPTGARVAFDSALGFFGRVRSAASEPATFLLDEFQELRTFESFPGLRRVQHDFIAGLSSSP